MTATDLPPEAEGRLEHKGFSSGLSVPDFAACLQMGLRPVGLVQGFCVMRWSWYGPGSPYAGATLFSNYRGGTLSSYRCPHGYMVSGTDHRTWGANVEQSWLTSTWAQGFNAAYQRMLEEAGEAGGHGVVGVVDRTSHLVGEDVYEFHLYGTAVVVEGAPAGASIWSTYLAGQRLAKLVEAGLFPVSVAASMASVRVWPVCATEMLMEGRWDNYGVSYQNEISQLADAQTQVRQLAADHIRQVIGHDTLHGVTMSVAEHERGASDLELTCTIRGNRVRRFRAADPLPAPRPTVTLR